MTGTISTVSQTNEDTKERKLSQPENVLNEDDVDWVDSELWKCKKFEENHSTIDKLYLNSSWILNLLMKIGM